jgi:hypothetical protein
MYLFLFVCEIVRSSFAIVTRKLFNNVFLAY